MAYSGGVPDLPRSSRYVATPDAVLAEAERTELVERLNAAYADGLISADDYERHLDTLFAARTLGEVAPVVTVLPGKTTHETPAVVAVGSGKPGELEPLRPPARLRATMTALGVTAAALLAVVVVLLVLL